MPSGQKYIIHYFNREGFPIDPETGWPTVIPMEYVVYGEEELKKWSDIIRIQYGDFGPVTWDPPYVFPVEPEEPAPEPDPEPTPEV